MRESMRQARRFPHISALLVIGTAFSVVLGAVMYVVDPNKSVGLICSLITLSITLTMEVISRFSDLSRSIGHGLEVLRILSKRPPWLFSLIEDCIKAADATIESYDHQILHDAARRYLQSCRDNLDDLSRGYMRVSADDKGLSLNVIRGTKQSLKAVSITRNDLPTWLTPSGERYLAENEAASGRGVQIERIFVYDSMSEDLSKLVRKLLAIKSKVYLLPYDKVPLDKRIDMVIFDETFAVETRTNAEGTFVENLFSANSSDIQKRVVDFSFLKGLAHEQKMPPELHTVTPIKQIEGQR